jgi:hypothetical protein
MEITENVTINATGHKCTFRTNIEQSQIDGMLERLRSAKDHIEITIDAEDYYRIKDSEKKQDE